MREIERVREGGRESEREREREGQRSIYKVYRLHGPGI